MSQQSINDESQNFGHGFPIAKHVRAYRHGILASDHNYNGRGIASVAFASPSDRVAYCMLAIDRFPLAHILFFSPHTEMGTRVYIGDSDGEGVTGAPSPPQ